MNIPDRIYSCAGVLSRRSHFFLPAISFLLALIILSGCTTTRQQTSVAGEINELRNWDGHEVVWVETAEGERIEFARVVDDSASSDGLTLEVIEGGGRIEGTRNQETRRVDYFVVGSVVGADSMEAEERRFPLADLTLVNTRVKEDDGWGTVSVITGAAATIVAGVVVISGL